MRWLALLIAFLLAPRLASGQPLAFDANTFRPSPNSLFALENAEPLPHLQLGFGFSLSFAERVVQALDTLNGDEVEFVSAQVATVLSASLGLKDRYQFDLSLPLALFQAGDERTGIDDGPRVQGASLGDLSLGGRVLLWRNPQTTFSLLGALGVPTGNSEQLFGEASAFGRLALLAGHHIDKLSLRGTLGLHAQPRAAFNFDNFIVGSALQAGAGALYEVAPHVLLGGELQTSLALTGDLSTGRSPAELRVGAKLNPSEGLWIPLGAGVGLVDQAGAPRFRAFAGLAYTPPLRSYYDIDHDGLTRADDCPTEPETRNEYQDSDGCPDVAPDADNDGVTIAFDQCPEEKGSAELHGCPDQDADALADKDDECPSAPEDKDGFQDEDGCPDPDNDGDTLADAADQCPSLAGPSATRGCPDQDGDTVADEADQCDDELEDFDGFQDEDGCADFDNDGDTLADNEDKCPNQAGPAFTQGCPESRIKITETSSLNFAELRIFFDLNSDQMQARSLPELDKIAEALKTDLAGRKIRVEGHTDDVGSVETNQKLSERRAARVMEYLVSQGVPADHLTSEGYGMSRPLVTGKTREARSKNRRVEFVLLD